MAEDNTRTNDFDRVKTDFVKVVTKDPKKTGFYVCKFVAVVFCIIAVILTDAPFAHKLSLKMEKFTELRPATVFVTLYGFSLINIILIVSEFIGEQLPKKMLLIFSSLGVVMCLATGVILIVLIRHDQETYVDNYIYPEQYRDRLLPSGVCSLLAAAAFAVDTYFTKKYA